MFCDWLTIHEEHADSHASPCNVRLLADYATGEVIERNVAWKELSTGNGAKCRVWSDGNRVSYDGNPSREGKLDNLFGVRLEDALRTVNQRMESAGLPAFSSEAVISRVDMTANVEAGEHQAEVLRWIQCRELGQREKVLYGLNTVFGPDSGYRTFRVYDKAKEIRDRKLRGTRGEERDYLEKLAAHCEARGLIRVESEMRSAFLRRKDLRRVSGVDHGKLAAELLKEMEFMKEIRVEDYADIPAPYIQTLTMWLLGIDPRSKMSATTFYKHRRELKKYGYDVAARPAHQMKPREMVIRLELAEKPDWYDDESNLPLKAVE